METHTDPERHPRTLFKTQDLEVARENIERHAWAQRFLENLLEAVATIRHTTADDLKRWIPRETPNSELFTMCPA